MTAPILDSVPQSMADSGPAPQSDTLAAGTVIGVQLAETLDSDSAPLGGFIVATVPDAVMGADGRLAIPAGSAALLVRRESDRPGDKSALVVSLFSLSFRGHQYRLANSTNEMRTTVKDDASAGPQHSGVHLPEGTRLDFKLPAAFRLHA